MAETVSIRLAVAADAEAIAALTREAYAKWVAVIGREPLPMTVDYAQAVQRRRFDLLQVDGQLAALIETVRRDDWLLIENVAVLPAFQRRGYGVRLLGLAEDLAAASGLAGTRLYTNKRFAENLRLYASLGYQTEREEALNGGVAVHMVKPGVVAPRGS
jgi:ribosomal protein S18 acetylase RimI-like enzyme